MRREVITADMRGPEGLPALPAERFASCVTDPPYELGFMGRTWDKSGVSFDPATWAEVFRVLKPGGHLLAFGGSRTFHRIAVAIEDAGFELRDTLCWLYGQGFPKSLGVARAIDRAAGIDVDEDSRSIASPHPTGPNKTASVDSQFGQATPGLRHLYVPATDAARAWEGWGTALKPAWEPVLLFRKPLRGLVAENVLAYGTGALNIDGCRIGEEVRVNPGHGAASGATWKGGFPERGDAVVAGRWPANVLADPEAGALIDAASGPRIVAGEVVGGLDLNTGLNLPGTAPGGASRFFYCAKATRAERNAGLADFAPQETSLKYGGGEGFAGRTQVNGKWVNTDKARRRKPRNDHPTVKPIALMRWLCRLITPPGEEVLDCFAGSGSTLVAAACEGLACLGIERDERYAAIARARLLNFRLHMEADPAPVDGDGCGTLGLFA